MPISVQDTLPDAIFYLKDEEGLQEMSLSSWAKGRKVSEGLKGSRATRIEKGSSNSRDSSGTEAT